MRVPNDTKLLESDIGVDLILGGHDHHYEVKNVSIVDFEITFFTLRKRSFD